MKQQRRGTRHSLEVCEEQLRKITIVTSQQDNEEEDQQRESGHGRQRGHARAPPCSGCFQHGDDVMHTVPQLLVCRVTCCGRAVGHKARESQSRSSSERERGRYCVVPRTKHLLPLLSTHPPFGSVHHGNYA
ncbi:unnamed protein product [Pleuronectes platessa]|uniref:Uncharacterized protein n=1 Tax=Pleuronectes platessa TaxID=8262 RepID=A0A9N7U0N8_PLEPL|nr:unnamed protein product [Pleuronectes platessa]